jgi:hypothetical protein
MKVKHVRAFGDSLLMVQQVAGVFNVLKDHLLHILICMCLDVIKQFAEF